MIENKCFCEKCRKIQPIIINSRIDTKEFNIGKISYNKLIGKCNICNEEVYSLELAKKNKNELNKKIKELEDEMIILQIIEDSKSSVLNIKDGDKKFLKELENILHKKK